MNLSDAEWKVMNAVWASRGPVSGRDVLEWVERETDWAYATVKTLLARLVEKGALKMHKRGNTSFFTALISRAQTRRHALFNLINKAFDGAVGPLVHCLIADESLSRRQQDALQRLLNEIDDPTPAKPPEKRDADAE